MLKEAKKFVQDLEEMLNRLSREFNKSIEELDGAFTDWCDNGGQYSSLDAFERSYRYDQEEEAGEKAYEKVYQKMRMFAANRGYDLQDWEIERIIDGAEADGDDVLDCADGALRELTEDWVADHQD